MASQGPPRQANDASAHESDALPSSAGLDIPASTRSGRHLPPIQGPWGTLDLRFRAPRLCSGRGARITIHERACPPSSVELPFDVDAALHDDDIVEIVDYLRTGPKLPTVVTPDGATSISAPSAVEAGNVIVAMEQKADGTILIRTLRMEGAGQLITVRRQGHGWQLSDIANWVA